MHGPSAFLIGGLGYGIHSSCRIYGGIPTAVSLLPSLYYLPGRTWQASIDRRCFIVDGIIREGSSLCSMLEIYTSM